MVGAQCNGNNCTTQALSAFSQWEQLCPLSICLSIILGLYIKIHHSPLKCHRMGVLNHILPCSGFLTSRHDDNGDQIRFFFKLREHGTSIISRESQWRSLTSFANGKRNLNDPLKSVRTLGQRLTTEVTWNFFSNIFVQLN